MSHPFARKMERERFAKQMRELREMLQSEVKAMDERQIMIEDVILRLGPLIEAAELVFVEDAR